MWKSNHGELYITELDSCCSNLIIFHCLVFEAVKFRNRDSFIEMYMSVSTLKALGRIPRDALSILFSINLFYHLDFGESV